MCPSSGADDCVVLSPRVGIVFFLKVSQVYETCCLLDSLWITSHRLRRGSSRQHVSYTCDTFKKNTVPTRGDNITQSSAPEDGHIVARNMLNNL